MDSPLAVFAVMLAAIWSAATLVLKANDFLTGRRDRIMNLDGGKELNKAEKLLLLNNDYRPTLIGTAIFYIFLLVTILASVVFLFNLEVSKRFFIIGIISLMFITLGYIFFTNLTFAQLRATCFTGAQN